jgi:hypothetical protein
MGVPLFSNNAAGTLAGSYNSAAVSLTLTAGQGSLFPSPSGGDWFMATIVNNLNVIEIVKVTARASDTLTVVRGQEGTAARALAAGEKIELRLTAGALDALKGKVQQTADIADDAITTSKLADLSVTASKLAMGAIDSAGLIANGVITAAKFATGAVLTALGFTPIQQGGGIGQTGNKIYIGWSTNRLRAQVDVTDIGYILTERDDGGASGAGYRGVPQVQIEANAVLGVAHGGKHILHAGGGTHNYEIPNDTTPFEYGTTIQIINHAGTVTITPAAGVTLSWSPSGGTGARTLAAKGTAWVQKIGDNLWIVHGVGIS